MNKVSEASSMFDLIMVSVMRLPSYWIPRNLSEEIGEALADEDRKLDMALQLLKLASHTESTTPGNLGSGGHPISNVELVDGMLFYRASDRLVVLGHEDFEVSSGYVIVRHLVVAGHVCLVERCHEKRSERIVWAGWENPIGTEYPWISIEQIGEADGELFYKVSVRPSELDRSSPFWSRFPESMNPQSSRPAGFVVWRGEEGELFRWRGNAIEVVHDMPTYVGATFGQPSEQVFVWGAVRAQAKIIGNYFPYNGGVLLTQLRYAGKEDQLVFIDSEGNKEVLLTSGLGELRFVSGKFLISQAMNIGSTPFDRLHHGLDLQVDFTWISAIRTGLREEDDLFVVSGTNTEGKPGVWVNLVKVSDMEMEPNSEIEYDKESKELLMTLQGSRSGDERTRIKLRDLGIIS